VEKLIEALYLYVLDHQMNMIDTRIKDTPFKPQPEELYRNWEGTNNRFCKEYIEKYNIPTYGKEKLNFYYEYNLNRKKINEELGRGYFVPKMYFFRKKTDGKIIRAITWPDNAPILVPEVDYILVYRSFGKPKEGIITFETLKERFGQFLSDFSISNCEIFPAENEKKTQPLFYLMKFDGISNDSIERIPADKIVDEGE